MLPNAVKVEHAPLFVFDHLDRQMLAPWAFKGAPIVVWFVWLDGNEPHLRIANFATRSAHYHRQRNDLRLSHGSVPLKIVGP